MKLYYLFISIFCIKIIGLFYYLSGVFCIQFIKHLENRIPQLIIEYRNNKFIYYLNKYFEIKNSIDYNKYYLIITSK